MFPTDGWWQSVLLGALGVAVLVAIRRVVCAEADRTAVGVSSLLFLPLAATVVSAAWVAGTLATIARFRHEAQPVGAVIDSTGVRYSIGWRAHSTYSAAVYYHYVVRGVGHSARALVEFAEDREAAAYVATFPVGPHVVYVDPRVPTRSHVVRGVAWRERVVALALLCLVGLRLWLGALRTSPQAHFRQSTTAAVILTAGVAFLFVAITITQLAWWHVPGLVQGLAACLMAAIPIGFAVASRQTPGKATP